MSKPQNKRDVADDAARARKLLDKHASVKISGLNKGDYDLQQGGTKELGEHAVILVLSGHIAHQYTVSRPIGCTEGDEKTDWVVNETSTIPAILTRRKDPTAGAVNQARSQTRNDLAVEHGLLIRKTVDTHAVLYYPHRVDTCRNDLLEEARGHLKQEVTAMRDLINQEQDKKRKLGYTQQLSTMVDASKFLDSVTATAETSLREFWGSAEVEEVIEIDHPRLYRTLGGAYGDTPQMLINGARGKTLDTVTNEIARAIANISFPGDQGAFGGPHAATPRDEEGGGGTRTAPPPERGRRNSKLLSSMGALAKTLLGKVQEAVDETSKLEDENTQTGEGEEKATPEPGKPQKKPGTGFFRGMTGGSSKRGA